VLFDFGKFLGGDTSSNVFEIPLDPTHTQTLDYASEGGKWECEVERRIRSCHVRDHEERRGGPLRHGVVPKYTPPWPLVAARAGILPSKP
jgi:hypothetical protein